LSSSENSDVKNGVLNEQQSVQKPTGQAESEANIPVNPANLEKQEELVVQSNLQADTKPTTITPERPRSGMARVIIPPSSSPTGAANNFSTHGS